MAIRLDGEESGGAAHRFERMASALTDRVPLEVLQAMQNRFAALGQVSVCLCSADGAALTRPTWGSRFSELIGTSPRGRSELADAMRRATRRGAADAPLVCLHGMSLYVTPIESQNRRLAWIVVGTRSAVWPAETQLRATADFYQLDAADLVRATEELDANIGGTPEAAHRFADGLAHTIATLYVQAGHIQRQLTDLRTVHELADLLSGTFDLQEILDVTVNRVVKVLPVKACGIRLLDERTGELVVKAVCNLSEEYLRKGPVMLRNNPIDAAAFAGETVYIEDAPADPRIRYPDNARREGIVSGLCVPLAHRGETVGVLRVYTGRRYVFSESEQDLLRSIASQAAAAIISHRLYQEQAEADRAQRQLRAAGEIQRRMLPAQPPRHARLSFGHTYAPTLQVGGDFYDFIERPSGEVCVAIADVVGKGFPAALLMASVRAALRSCVFDGDDPATVLSKVNRHLFRDTLPGEFATLMYGVFSADGTALTYGNAGHTPPLWLRDGECQELTSGGLVIGLKPDTPYDIDVVRLRPGDVLAMTTDGVTEAMDFDGSQFGRARLIASIRRHRALDAQPLARQILWDVRRFVGLADQSDDISVVVVKAL
jgi:serine phosphatase RsbU (regulator of sigma subunit)